uniref:Protein-PII uridylyltransferase N-terminal domain-containing protein n=1 Tax=Branchiostoma floridae TaxID=7739 RepID=C3XT44_BRAFL|eukprot:XP_002612768.1 hypothetical protein BRAFLDRAFT_97251 [Branchiostoma floridae]
MLRVCEKLREADAKGRIYGLARAETGYLRALVDAMADMDRLAEVELLKSLGDVNLEKGRLGKDVGKFNMALALYVAAVVRCDHRDQGEGIEHRYEYTERLSQGVSSKGSQDKEHLTKDKETTTPAKVAGKFQDLDRKRATGGNTDSVLVGYAQLMVEGIVNDNSMLETEAMKSLGDVYLKRGTETRDTRNLTRASALYNKALARCHNVQGTVVIVHRLLYTAKIRQEIITTKTKRSARAKRQHGTKDHFSQFSAAPIDVIDDDTRRLHVSYHRYLQTADRDLGNGDLDAAEQNLAAALKLVHDRYKPDKAREADCLCRLGDVYVEGGKRTGEGRTFTQAAALYNASMARTDGDKQNMVSRLQETERQFLRNTCNLDCEPCPYSSAVGHRKELDSMRARVKSQLDTIHQEHKPYQYDEDDPAVREVEIKRAEAIKNLFKRITGDRQKFIQVLTDECIAKLGPPPCKYAFIGLGSQATELVTPYSDLEFAILIEEGKDDDDTRRYFLNLTHYLHLKVINLSETILPAMAIPSLNDFLSEDPEKDWFFDSVTPRGFAFDGFMPWASKTPFGRDKTRTKDPVSLIQTPAKLAEYQHLHIALAEGYHLSDILRRVTYLIGDKPLVDEYTDRVNKSVDRSADLSRLSALLLLRDNIKQLGNVEPTGQLLDVKKEIYRFPSVAVDVLSICCGIVIPSVWGMIEELQKTRRISEEDAHHLTVLISISAELRLRTYIANGGQKDRLSPLTEMKTHLDKHEVDGTFVQSVFYIPDSKMLFRYYYTAIPLKTCIVKTVGRESERKKLFQNAIFDNSSLTRGRITQQLFHLDASLRQCEAALEEAGSDEEKQNEILFELGKVLQKRGEFANAMSYYRRALTVGNNLHGESKENPNIASLLENIGVCWSELGNQSKALIYLEQSLKMMKAIYGETTALPHIAGTLNNIGNRWSDLGDKRKAIRYYEQSLKIRKAIYGETTAHPDIASSLNNIGSCWSDLGDKRKALRYYDQSLKMRETIYGETTAHPDIAASLYNIGMCWSDLGDKRKALRYHEQSLKMREAIYGETTEHPDIASSLGNIGNCWSDLGDKRKAIWYHEESLKMRKAIYSETTAHPDIAASLNNIGTCWSGLGDQRKAIRYYEQSLKMNKAMYGETTEHPDIATSLNNIGKCWSDLGDKRKAIRYYEQSLKMRKIIYGETTAHPDIAASLNNIGNCWSNLGDQRKAICYHEQSLKMMKDIYGETTAHSNIAASLNNIGNCWSDLDDKGKAIWYHKQSLKIMKAIYGETTAHPDIASLLNNIGNCWSDLGDKRKAIRYHEQSLQMKKAIYGETHPDIASSLNNIGTCWSDLGDKRIALRYHDESLKMMKAIHGETTAHPNIASSINNIGNCWSDLGDKRKALKFLEQSLKMKKALYGETHPAIASSLNNIGLCWYDLGDKRKALGYFEQSLQMWKAIYGETTAHPHIASSLNNIGACWSDLGDKRKALMYYEQSLKMNKAIHGETTAHPAIAASLNNIGNRWIDLGDKRKAIRYHEQSLKMTKAIYGETTAHPDIAASLNNIGNLWSDLGDQRKAILYYEQSLKMKKAIYGETTAHPDIAKSLNNIGLCWNKLGNQSKALSYYEQSVKMMKAIYGSAHPSVVKIQNNIRKCRNALRD